MTESARITMESVASQNPNHLRISQHFGVDVKNVDQFADIMRQGSERTRQSLQREWPRIFAGDRGQTLSTRFDTATEMVNLSSQLIEIMTLAGPAFDQQIRQLQLTDSTKSLLSDNTGEMLVRSTLEKFFSSHGLSDYRTDARINDMVEAFKNRDFRAWIDLVYANSHTMVETAIEGNDHNNAFGSVQEKREYEKKMYEAGKYYDPRNKRPSMETRDVLRFYDRRMRDTGFNEYYRQQFGEPMGSIWTSRMHMTAENDKIAPGMTIPVTVYYEGTTLVESLEAGELGSDDYPPGTLSSYRIKDKGLYEIVYVGSNLPLPKSDEGKMDAVIGKLRETLRK